MKGVIPAETLLGIYTRLKDLEERARHDADTIVDLETKVEDLTDDLTTLSQEMDALLNDKLRNRVEDLEETVKELSYRTLG